MSPQTKPRVFVSYSWDSELHRKRVRDFVFRLRSSGIDVIYDDDLVLGDRLPHFMERAVAESDVVLYICTPDYKYKADNRISGAGYESSIISSEIYESQDEQKFIPVLFSGTWKTAVPTWSKGKLGIDLSSPYGNETEYGRLLEAINRRQRTSSPSAITAPVRPSHHKQRRRQKKQKKLWVTAIILIMALTFSGVLIAESMKTRHVKDVYIDFLFHNAIYQEGAWNANYIRFAFGFVDEDNIPELFICQDDSHSSSIQIYSYNQSQDKVLPLGNISSFGHLSYYEKQNLVAAQFGGMGYWCYAYERIQNDGTLQIVAIAGDDSGAVGDDKATYYWASPYAPSEDSRGLFDNNDKYSISEERYRQRVQEFLSDYDSDKIISIDFRDMNEITRKNVANEFERVTRWNLLRK